MRAQWQTRSPRSSLGLKIGGQPADLVMLVVNEKRNGRGPVSAATDTQGKTRLVDSKLGVSSSASALVTAIRQQLAVAVVQKLAEEK